MNENEYTVGGDDLRDFWRVMAALNTHKEGNPGANLDSAYAVLHARYVRKYRRARKQAEAEAAA